MVDIVNGFEVVLVSYEDVREQHPEWTDIAIEDYMARLRDVIQVAEDTNKINAELEVIVTGVGAGLQAQMNVINERLGSGDPLTWDDTGFTFDNTNLTWDRTEY